MLNSNGLDRATGLRAATLRHLQSLVGERSRAAWEIGDILVAAYGLPPVQGRNDASGPRLAALAELLGVSVSWLIRLRVTSAAWPLRHRKVAIAWTVSKHLATRPDRVEVLDAFALDCERAGVAPSLARLLVWEDAEAPRPAAVRRRLDPLQRALRLALALDPGDLQRLLAEITAALNTPVAA